jgi:hypothetical protein
MAFHSVANLVLWRTRSLIAITAGFRWLEVTNTVVADDQLGLFEANDTSRGS